jgi:hypothetical protein
MKRICLIIAAIFGFALLTSPAIAGKNDDNWAKCLWENAPRTATNWLSMPEPKRDYGLAQPPVEYVIQFRLRGACQAQMTPPGKKWAPDFNAKSVRTALLRMKPTEIPPDKLDPKAFRCTRYFLNDKEFKNPAAFEWGFGEGAERKVISSITYFFSSQGGGSVGLPDSGGLKKCQWIKDDGTFVDA